MSLAEHVRVVREGAAAIEEWRHSHPKVTLDCSDTDLSGVNLYGADLGKTKLQGSNLDEACLSMADLIGADLGGASIRDADLNGAYLSEADLSSADLSMSDLVGTDLSEATLSWARLNEAVMCGANLTDARLEHASLDRADLTNASLNSAQLRDASLRHAKLAAADLSLANLHNADLFEADLRAALLCGANLTQSNLTAANFHSTDLRDADLDAASLFRTQFSDTNIANALNLDLVNHLGPSSVGMDTIIQARGGIPEAFLQGAGIPEQVTEHLSALVDLVGPLQRNAFGILHGLRDEAFAQQLRDRLRHEGLVAYCMPDDDESVVISYTSCSVATSFGDHSLLVLSESSMASNWIGSAIRLAKEREQREGRRLIVPLRLAGMNNRSVAMDPITQWRCIDQESGIDMAVEIRQHPLIDFSRWQDHEQFEAAILRLLDLL